MVTNSVGRIALSVVPGRAEPSDKSEMTTELLFGEKYEVLEEQSKWMLVKSIHDNYEAWIDRKQHNPLGNNEAETIRLPYLYNIVCSETGENSILPMSALIPSNWSFNKLEQEDEVSVQNKLEQTAMRYLGVPYRWGGRSPMGIDCSGFVQNVYLNHAVSLPRDAYLQAEVGSTISFVEEVQTGDLAFFDNAEGKIIHVGIVLKDESKTSIIHASGSVRIDAFDHEGIFNSESNSYSHKLRLIKRLS